MRRVAPFRGAGEQQRRDRLSHGEAGGRHFPSEDIRILLCFSASSDLLAGPTSRPPCTAAHRTRPAKKAAERSVSMADAICAGEPRAAPAHLCRHALLSFRCSGGLHGLRVHSLATPALAARVLNSPHVRLLPVDFLQAGFGAHFNPRTRVPGAPRKPAGAAGCSSGARCCR